jgi:hypothetical protein
VSSEERKTVNTLIDRALANGARQSKADTFINLVERRIRNWRNTMGDYRIVDYRITEEILIVISSRTSKFSRLLVLSIGSTITSVEQCQGKERDCAFTVNNYEVMNAPLQTRRNIARKD